MKFQKIIISNLLVMAVASMYLSCTRDTPAIAARSGVNYTSTVQVFSAMLKAARNYVYVDGVPVSGTTHSYQGVFPGTAYGFDIGASAHTFLIKDTLPATTQVPLTFTQTLEVGKSYTIFTYDTITSPKQVMVLNNIDIPKDTTCRLRFANFVYNPLPVPNVDVYSFRRGGVGGMGALPVFANVPTYGVTDFVPFASQQTDTLYVYATGTTTLMVKQFVTSLTPQRFYTACYNGSYRGAISTRAVTTFANY